MPEKPFELLYYKKSVYASWELRENATAYEITVQSGGREVCRRRFKAQELVLPVRMMDAAKGEEYQGELVTILDREEAVCRIPDGRKLLESIMAGLTASRKGSLYTVDRSSLSCEVPGAVDSVFRMLENGLKLDALFIDSPSGPALNDEQTELVLEGSCACQKNIKGIRLSFAAAEDGEILLTVSSVLSDEWRFSDLFPELSGRLFDRLAFKNVWFTLETERGLTLGGLLSLTDGDGKAIELDWECPVDNTGGEPAFEISPARSLIEYGWCCVPIREPGRSSLCFTPEKLLVYNKPSGSVREEKAAVLCRGRAGGREAMYELTLPLEADPLSGEGSWMTAVLSGDLQIVDTVKDIMAEIGGEELVSLLPSFLLLSGLEVKRYEIQTDNTGLPRGRRVLTVMLPDCELIPSLLTLGNTEFSITTFYNEVERDVVKKFYKASLKAEVKTGELCMEAELEISDEDRWELMLKPDPQNDIMTAAGKLFGFDSASVIAGLPDGLSKALNVGVNEFSVVFDPFAQKIEYIRLIAGQCGDWEILPDLFTLCSWNAEIRLRQEPKGFRTAALAEGMIRLGTGGDAPSVRVRIPLGDGISDITLRMEEGKVTLPTVQDFFEAMGMTGAANALPDGFAALGGPCIDDIAITLTPGRAPFIRSVYVSFQTVKSWVLITEHSLSLKNVSAQIRYSAEEKKVTGTIRGRIAVGGVEVGVRLTNAGRTSDWELSVLLDRPVHIPSIAEMQSWLLPESFLESIPETLMPFPAGLNLNRFSMECNLSGKCITALDFMIENCGEWQVLPSLLTLKAVTVQSSFQELGSPKRTARFHARAVMQLGGNRILMELKTGSESASMDTILTGELGRNYMNPVSLSEVAGEGAIDIASLPVATDFVMPVLESLKASANLTKEQYVICAVVEKLGELGFAMVRKEGKSEEENKTEVQVQEEQAWEVQTREMQAREVRTQEIQADRWEYFAVFKLKEEFLFADVIPSLSVVDRLFRVKKAGLVLSSFESESLPSVVESVRECAELCPGEGLAGKALRRGLLIYGQIVLKDSGFASILQLGDGMEEGLLLSVSSYLAEKAEDSVFTGSLSEFWILKLLCFRDVTVRYVPGQNGSFTLCGEIALTVNSTEYAFSGSMEMNREKGDFSVSTVHEIDRPLGIPGISVKELKLAVHCEFATETRPEKETRIALTGKAGFGRKDDRGQEPLILEGSLVYDEDDFQIVQIALSKPLSVEELFATVFTDNVWPSGLLPLTFCTGALYYAKKDCEISEKRYYQGMHLNTEIAIYGFAFSVGVDVLEDGINVSGAALAPVELWFISLTDASCSGGGPGVFVRTTGGMRELGLEGGITLFGERFLSVPAILYRPEKEEFGGTIRYDGSIELFRGNISFTWSEKNGFQLTDWPMQWITDALDYAKLIEQASRMTGGECDAIVDLIWSETITTKCKITPSFSTVRTTGEAGSGGLPLALTIEYEVMVKSQSVIKTALAPLQLAIPMPESITLEGLAEMIFQAVKTNVVEVIKQIFQDTEKLTKFMALIAVTSYGKKAAASLLCRGLKTDMKGRSAASKAAEYAKKAKEVSGGSSGSGGSGGGTNLPAAAEAAAGAGAATEEAESFLAAAAAFFASIFAFFLIGSNERERAEEAKEEAQKEKERAERAEREAREAVRQMLTLDDVRCLVLADREKHSISLSWSKAAQAEDGVLYHVQVDQSTEGSGAHGICDRKLKDNSCVIAYQPTEEKVDELTVKIAASYSYQEKKGIYTYLGDTCIRKFCPDIRFTAEQSYYQEKIKFSWKAVWTAKEYVLKLQTAEGEDFKIYSGLKNNWLEIDLMASQEFQLETCKDMRFVVVVVSDMLKDTRSQEKELTIPDRDMRISGLKERFREEKRTNLEVSRGFLRQFPDLDAGSLAAIVRELFPEITAETVTDILYLLLNGPEDPILISGYEYKISGMDYVAVTKKIKEQYPSITAAQMADILDELF